VTSPSLTSTYRIDPELAEYPRLSRFYGLSFFELVSMPRWAFRLYYEAMPRLSAEEQLMAIQAAAAPHTSKQDQSKIFRALRRMVRRDDAPEETEKVDTRTVEGQVALAGLGIGVRKGDG
jgi:hypothetical protein